MSYIQLNDLIKRYEKVLAVDNVSIDIEKGEIFGLLGPNGAGKSTTIKMLMGLLKPNSGNIIVDGLNIKKNNLKVKSKMGFVSQELAIYDTMTAAENVRFFGSLYGLKGNELKNRTKEALQFVGLSEKNKMKAKKYSGGMKRRLNIACAIVHQPEIIIMDEPTVGIDAQSRIHILESVLELNRRGATIVYSSHYMEEVETICNRIGIIDRGKLIACDEKEKLKKQYDFDEKIIIEAMNIRYNPIEEIKKISAVISVKLDGETLVINTSNAQLILQDIMFLLSKNDVQVKNIQLEQPDLESVFLLLTGRTLKD